MRKLSKKFAGAFVAASLLLTPVVVQAQYALNFRDAEIRAVVQDVSRITGRTFIVDQKVQAKISVVTDRPLSRSEYFEVFLSTLRANGLVVVPTAGGAYRIQTSENAASQPSRIGTQGAASSQLVTEVFRLQSIDATSVIETLRPLVSKEGSVTANRAANSVIVADYADNVRRIRSLIQRIDRDSATSTIIPLKNAGAREIAESLQALVGGGQTAAGVSVVAIDSSNSLALRGDPQAVARFAAMARELDERAEGGAEVRVYWLEHADAEQLLPVLQQLLGQPVTQSDSTPQFMREGVGDNGDESSARSAPAASAAPATGGSSTMTFTGIAGRGPAVVTRYAGTNAIIVAASDRVQKQIGEVIRQLDTRREQVLVEAIIVELSDDAAKRLGVQYLLAGENIPFAATNYSNAQPNILTLGGAYGAYKLEEQTTVIDGNVVTTTRTSPLGNDLQKAAAASILGANGVFAGGAFDIGKNAVFGTILNAVKSDTYSNLLSTPSIMTLDNQQATMLVGQEVPVTTGEALSDNFDNAFRTVQRENVGIQLDVKPQVNSSGTIKLFLRQEVSSVAGPVSSNSSDLIINKREFKTTLTVDDGDILAIGGLIDDNERRTIEKVPLLGDVPVLGNLFKSRSRTKEKTNLMVFIRPTIIRDREDARALTARRYGYIRGQQYLDRPGVEPSLDVLVRDYMGAVAPAPPLQPGDTVVDSDGRVMRILPDGKVEQVETTPLGTIPTPSPQEVKP